MLLPEPEGSTAGRLEIIDLRSGGSGENGKGGVGLGTTIYYAAQVESI